jgi:PAS domain S-box-containing protein
MGVSREVPGVSSLLRAVGLAVAVGLAYFLAARVGVFLGVSQGVPIFWPAAGIAVGAFITLGPNGRLPVAVAIIAANFASGMLAGRSLSLTITFATVNAGEAFLTAWLLERWFGRTFRLDSVRQVLGFVVASAVSEAIAASGAGFAVHYLQPTTSSAFAWRLWFASCSLGIFTVAPLLIGLGEIVRELPPRRELIEGTVGLAVLAVLSALVTSLPDPWGTALPVAVVVPVLLWVIVRCRPAFAAAAMFIVALAVFWSTTFDQGPFADAGVSLPDRILAAQTLVLAAAILALVLAALFAERRRNEAALKQGRERLAEEAIALTRLHDYSSRLWQTSNLNEGLVVVLRGSIEMMGADKGNVQIIDARGVLTIAVQEGFDQPFLEFFKEVSVVDNSACGRALRAGRRVIVEDVETDEDFAPFRQMAFAAGIRAVQSTPIMARDGKPLGMISTHFCNAHRPSEYELRILDLYARTVADFIERHRSDEALRQSKERYQGIYEYAGTGIYIANLTGRFQKCNPAYATMHGYTEEELCKLSITDLVHPEDWPRHTPEIQLLLSGKIPSFKIVNRCVAKSGDILWVHKHVSLLRDAAGRPESLLALVDDVTERKRAEDARRILNAELDHRVKNALATVGAVVSHTSQGHQSVADFVVALEGRLRAMASAHELLSARGWQGMSLTELVRRELAPYGTRRNIEIDGPDVTLGAEAGQAMAMVLHELATNAAKYGAFSTQDGQVSIRWDRQQNGHLPSLLLEWREKGGPPIVAPDRSGYGVSTIRDLIPYEFGGTVDLGFAREGVRCRLTLPADWLGNDRQPEMSAHASLLA